LPSSSSAGYESPLQARVSEGGRSSGSGGAADVRQAALERLAAEHGILNGGPGALDARPPLSAEERAERVLALLSMRGAAAEASAQKSRDAAATASAAAAATAAASMRQRGATPEPAAHAAGARRRAWSPAPAHARGAGSASASAAAAAAAAAKRPASAPRSRGLAPPAPAPPVVPAPFALSRCAPDGRHNTAKVAAEVAAARAKELTFRPALNPPLRRAPSPFSAAADAPPPPPPVDRSERLHKARPQHTATLLRTRCVPARTHTRTRTRLPCTHALQTGGDATGGTFLAPSLIALLFFARAPPARPCACSCRARAPTTPR
jgi:hypothetical protein